MKYCVIVILTSIVLNLNAQIHQNWLNYTNSIQVRDIDIRGNDVWISSQGGLIKYNKENGSKEYFSRANSNLPDNNLLSVLCGSNDNIWITSMHYGIGKFKNLECIVYNESNSSLPFNQWNIKILEDSENNIWISSFRWMAKFNGTDWKRWITGSDFSAFPAITSFDIDSNDVVWLFSSDGIGKIENDEYSVVSSAGSGIVSQNSFVKVDNNNQVWVSIYKEGIYKYDGIEFVNYNTQNSCLPTDTITAISFDSENNAWLSTYIGLVKFNLNSCELYQPNGNEQSFLTIEYFNDNEIWCGGFNGKLLKFNGSTFECIELSNSPLKSNEVTDIYSNCDDVWIGTSENIVICENKQLKHCSDIKDGHFTKDEYGNLWIASNTEYPRLIKINGNDTIVYDSLNSPINSQITFTDILANSNGLWAATKNHGLFKYINSEFTNYNMTNSDIPTNKLFCLTSDNQNNLWIGSKNGLITFNGVNWVCLDTTNSKIPTNWVKDITIDNENNVWLSCLDENNIKGIEYGGGLTKFDGITMQTYNISNSGLLSNTIFSLVCDDNKIWLGTEGAGLMSFDKNNEWKTYNVLNSGISNNTVSSLSIDCYGNIWMGHGYLFGGISVFNPDSVIQTVGLINEPFFNYNSSLVIYPNPVKNELFVNLNLTNEKITKADIYDLNGRLLQIIPEDIFNKKSSICCFKIQDSLPVNQVLLLSLKTDNGNVFNGRFIVSK